MALCGPNPWRYSTVPITSRLYLGSSKKRLNKTQICVAVDYFGIKLGLEERKAKEKAHTGSWTLVLFKGGQGFLSSVWVLSGMEGHLEVACDPPDRSLSFNKQGKEQEERKVQ